MQSKFVYLSKLAFFISKRTVKFFQGSMPTLLRTQYRCHPYISAVANKLFYGGMLEDGVSEQDRKPLLVSPVTFFFRYLLKS